MQTRRRWRRVFFWFLGFLLGERRLDGPDEPRKGDGAEKCIFLSGAREDGNTYALVEWEVILWSEMKARRSSTPCSFRLQTKICRTRIVTVTGRAQSSSAVQCGCSLCVIHAQAVVWRGLARLQGSTRRKPAGNPPENRWKPAVCSA